MNNSGEFLEDFVFRSLDGYPAFERGREGTDGKPWREAHIFIENKTTLLEFRLIGLHFANAAIEHGGDGTPTLDDFFVRHISSAHFIVSG